MSKTIRCGTLPSGVSFPTVAQRAALSLLLFALGVPNASAATEWQSTNEVGKRHDVVVAVCIPGEEVVCIGFGCRDAYGFDFVQMIVGDWLEGRTRLDAAGHTTTVSMTADDLASREMNIPVSRGYVATTFVERLVGRTMLRVEALNYAAFFPLAGFDHAYAALRQTCDAALSGGQPFRER